MNPSFGSGDEKENLQWVKENIGSDNAHVDSVGAISQQLPFKDDSFDLVISHGAIPAHLPEEPVHYRTSITEAMRVAKPGAEIILAPMEVKHKELMIKVLGELQVPNEQIEVVEIPRAGDYNELHQIERWYRIKLKKVELSSGPAGVDNEAKSGG